MTKSCFMLTKYVCIEIVVSFFWITSVVYINIKNPSNVTGLQTKSALIGQGVMAWQKFLIHFLWSIILCNTCTDCCYCIFPMTKRIFTCLLLQSVFLYQLQSLSTLIYYRSWSTEKPLPLTMLVAYCRFQDLEQSIN